MIRKFIYLILVVLTLLGQSCTEAPAATMLDDDYATVVLDITQPSTSVVSRAFDDTSVDYDNAVLYAFRNGKLIAKHIQSHAASSEFEIINQKLYIRQLISREAITFLLIANVDVDGLTDANLPADLGSSFSDAVSAINNQWMYEVASHDGRIPMAGAITLPAFNNSQTGTIALRRSLAKVTVNFLYEGDDMPLEDNQFEIEEIKVLNCASHATVFNSSTNSPLIPASASAEASYSSTVINPGTNSISVFVPESWNLDEKTQVIVKARYKGTGGENYFSLEFIRDGASEKEKSLLRNNHYIFTITNYSEAGYTTEEQAIAAMPMNILGTGSSTEYGTSFYVLNEDILSITAEYGEEGEVPNFVGVSDQNIEMRPTDECVRVTVVTNVESISNDKSLCQPTFDFTLTNKLEETATDALGNTYTQYTYTLWIWREGHVEVGDTYTFYIKAATIRKPMTITIVASL